MIIIVTGTPGTGKTTLAHTVAEKFDLRYIDGNRVIEEHCLKKGYDKERDTYIIDFAAFMEVLTEMIKGSTGKGMVIDSHLSHNLSPDLVDLCVVTKCSLPTLKQRLEKRGYKQTKVRENLDAEIFDVCRVESLETGHDVKIVWTG